MREKSPDHNALDSDSYALRDAVHEDYCATMPPLEHAPARQVPVPHADLQIHGRVLHDALIGLRRIVSKVLDWLAPVHQRAGDAPDDDTRPMVDVHDHAAVGDRTATGHAQRPSYENIPFLYVQLSCQHWVVGNDSLSRAHVLRVLIEYELDVAAQRVLSDAGSRVVR